MGRPETVPGEDACSSTSQLVGEPLAGTAPHVRSWIVVEEPGPWGREALRDSPIPAHVVAFLDEVCAHTGTRAIAARHATRRRLVGQPRHVWLAVSDPTVPGGQQLRHTMVDDLDNITHWDRRELSKLEHGQLPDIGEPVDGPIEFICTHSGRDACCALLGRARALSRQQAWECSHLGGHRFAATALVLPHGSLFGRLGPHDELDAAHLRGASYLPPELQVAEVAVRQRFGLPALSPLQTERVTEIPGESPAHSGASWALVRDGAGEAWRVRCESQDIQRPASCHAPATTATVWQATDIVHA